LTEAPGRPRIVGASRRVVAGAAVGPLALLVAAMWTEARGDLPPSVVGGMTLLGLVAPALGWRVHVALRERAARTPTALARYSLFLPATIAALAVTGSAALAGVVVFAMTRDPAPLVGVAMHVILSGALWPSEERVEAFVDVAPGESS